MGQNFDMSDTKLNNVVNSSPESYFISPTFYENSVKLPSTTKSSTTQKRSFRFKSLSFTNVFFQNFPDKCLHDRQIGCNKKNRACSEKVLGPFIKYLTNCKNVSSNREIKYKFEFFIIYRRSSYFFFLQSI